LELDEIFSDDSQCEAAEMMVANMLDCFLLSFTGSTYVAFNQLHFKRQDARVVAMPNVAGRLGVLLLLASQSGFYDLRSTDPPRDFQTVLVKQVGRFARTGKIERDGRRQVYSELATGKLFYVDNLHYGLKAHLEAFDQQEEHLGAADIERGAIDESARVRGRRLHW
jgi:hypothetical protein